MAVGPEARPSGLKPDKKNQCCSRLRFEEPNLGCDKFCQSNLAFFINEVYHSVIGRVYIRQEEVRTISEFLKTPLLKKKYKLPFSGLCSGNVRHENVKARRIVLWVAVCEVGCSGAEVARHPGVTNSCITRLMSSGGKPDVEDL